MTHTLPTDFPARPYQNTPEDRQTIFSAIWDWFITQSHPVCVLDGHCTYRDRTGTNACAIGIFLPPGPMTKVQGGVRKLYSLHPNEMARIFAEELVPFLSNLQCLHDWSTTNKNSENHISPDNLIEFARENNLIVPVNQ